MIAFLLVLGASQVTPDEIFQNAVRNELEGNPQQAQSEWEKLVQSGLHNADVEFDLGTSYAQTGDFGPAILHLRRASLLRPSADITANLQLVRERLLQRNPGKSSESSLVSDLASFLIRMPLEWILGAALIAAAAFMFMRYGPWALRTRPIGVGFSLSVTLVVVASALLAVRAFALDGKPAVVVMKRAAAKNGPDERFKTLAELVPGEELWLLPSKEASLGFIAVQLVGGETAYVSEGSLSKVKDW